LWHSGDSTKSHARHDCGAHSRSAKADAQAEHRIVMHDAAFDPISAIPAREHIKQKSDKPLAYDPPL
jgi:hypothetical protein